MKRLEVKVLGRIGGKSSGEAGLLKRVLRKKRRNRELLLEVRRATCRIPQPLFSSQGGRHSWHEGNWCDSARRRPAFQSALGPEVYVALDRPEILYAAKTVASFMQSPTKSAVAKLKGSHPPTLRRRRNRLSRCPARRRNFTLARAGPRGEPCHFLTQAGHEVNPRVWSDNSACRGIVRRQGTGRLTHLEIRQMWTQRWQQEEKFLLKSVRTDENVAGE